MAALVDHSREVDEVALVDHSREVDEVAAVGAMTKEPIRMVVVLWGDDNKFDIRYSTIRQHLP